MFSAIAIQRFRRFEAFELGALGQVNLLVGTNNAGKSSILEAIALLSSAGDLRPLWVAMTQRGELIRDKTGRYLDLDMRRIFHDHTFEDTVIVLSGVYAGPLSPSHTVIVGIRVDTPMGLPGKSPAWNDMERRVTDMRGEGPIGGLFVVANRDLRAMGAPVDLSTPPSELDEEGHSAHILPVLRGGVIPREFLDPHRRSHDLDPVRAVRMISTAGLSADEVVQLATQIALLPEEQHVLEAMQLVYPEIESYRPIATLVDTPALDTWGRSNRGGVIVKLRGRREPVPIGSLGDGVWRFLGLALSLATSAGGVLLVDEIDTGLHHTVLDKMWAMVATTAERLGVQVFATTHSRDCVESLASIARPGVGDGSQVTIQRIDPDRPEAIRYSEAEIIAAAEHGIEVR